MNNAAQLVTQAPTLLDWLSKLVVPALALIGGLAGAAYTAMQYVRGRKWRSSDLAAKLISDLSTDDELAFACQALDWGTGVMIVPVRYRPLLVRPPLDPKNPLPRELGQIIDHDPYLMSLAVQVMLSFDYVNYPGGLIYRYCFDKLAAHLSNVNRLLVNRQISLDDLQPYAYWLARIAVYLYPPNGQRGDNIFQPFLMFEEFGYAGVIELGKKLGVKGWKEPLPAR